MRIPDSFPGDLPYPSRIDRTYLLGLESEDSTTSIRVHPRKGQHISPPEGEGIPWIPNGYYLKERPTFTLDPAFHAGAYYVQDAGSMLLHWVLEQIPLKSKEEIRILDLCGAPGGKSTLIAEWLDGEGLLHANEVIQSRAQILAKNLSKCGYANVIITQLDPKDIGNLEQYYDIIIVDAPCSGEGMWRKDPKTMDEWSVEHVHLCAARQERILEATYPALAPDGFLIYATCTFNDLENIQQIEHICAKTDLQSISLSPPEAWKLISIDKNGHHGIQCLPGTTKGEGLFIALLQNHTTASKEYKAFKKDYLKRDALRLIAPFINEEAQSFPYIKSRSDLLFLIPPLVIDLYHFIKQKNKVIRTGLLAGKLTNRLFIPSHELVLSLYLNNDIAAYEMSKEEALSFLRKELHKINHSQKGWLSMNYLGLPIAWSKNLGNRINNYLPKGDIIRIKQDKQR